MFLAKYGSTYLVFSVYIELTILFIILKEKLFCFSLLI